ncbi:hypothetical protein AB6A40_004848 [Gnathostoma spinigerum]|uniref:RING-type domain-containing protein n=1 Tax=Gnathostoma spinigerum TaxID=75299 RepID=A0ABD6ELF3_9BILA
MSLHMKKSSKKDVLEMKIYMMKTSEDDFADLTDCGLMCLPDELYNICRVLLKKTIQLDRNNLSTLLTRKDRDSLRKMNGVLERLFVSHNKIRNIPDSLFVLTSLVVLDLSFNLIKVVPSDIGMLTLLEELHIQGNQISEIPSTFGQLVNLRKLNISSNHVRRLPLSFVHLELLEQLQLDFKLMEFPASEICQSGIDQIHDYLVGIAEKEGYSSFVSKSINIRSKQSSLDAGTSSPILSVSDLLFSPPKSTQILDSMSRMDEENRCRIRELSEEQKKLDELVSKSVLLQSEAQRDVVEAVSKLEQHAQRVIRSTLSNIKNSAALPSSQINDDIDSIIHHRKEKRVKEMQELTAAIEEENRMLQEHEMKYAEERRNNSMNLIVCKMDELEHSVKVSEQVAKSSVERICDEIVENDALMDDLLVTVKEYRDEDSKNILTQIRLIENTLCGISSMEMRRRQNETSELVHQLENERLQLLSLFEELIAERDYRRKLLRMKMRSEEEREQVMQRKVVADCLRKYAEMLCEVAADSVCDKKMETEKGDNNKSQLALSSIFGPLSRLRHRERTRSRNLVNHAFGSRDKDSVKEDFTTEIVQPFSAYAESKTSSLDPSAVHYEDECVICMNASVRVLFSPCGHACCCHYCYRCLFECPLCRKRIMKTVPLSSKG